MYVRRNLAKVLTRVSRQYPVVTVTGPRQSGKTTMCRHVFPRKRYVNLERIDDRMFAATDPRGFIANHPDGAVLDEVQHVPELLSYLQAEVDDDPRPGRWILTGSEHFGLSGSVAQTLAGRTGILHLLPLAIDDLGRFLSVDPVCGEVGSSQSWNRYSYVQNNPLKAVDPNGEDLHIVYDFAGSGLSSSIQTAVMLGTRQRFINAGVNVVNNYIAGSSAIPRGGDAGLRHSGPLALHV